MVEYPGPQGPSGWSFAKVIGVILGLIGMVGFGLCTLCGLVFAGSDSEIWVWVIAGAVMTFLSVWLMVTMVRKAREEREAHQNKDSSNNP